MKRANICCTADSVVNSIWFFFILLREMKFIDAFAELPKAVISFFMSLSPSVHPHRTKRFSHWADFHEIRYLNIFPTLLTKFKVH